MHAALKAGRDPLRELGLPDAPLTVATSTLLFDLLTPKDDGENSDSHQVEDAESMADDMEREEAWDAATGEDDDGYQGPRGVTPPGATRITRPLRDPRATPDLIPVWRWPMLMRPYGYVLRAASPTPRPDSP